MIVHDDGSFYLEKGETIPFACPECGWPKQYADNPPPAMTCDHCGKANYLCFWEAAEFKQVTVQ